MEEQIKKILEEEIKPRLALDGGSVEFVALEDGIVKVKLQGACGSCPGAQMTLKMGIERILQEKIPEIKEVIAV